MCRVYVRTLEMMRGKIPRIGQLWECMVTPWLRSGRADRRDNNNTKHAVMTTNAMSGGIGVQNKRKEREEEEEGSVGDYFFFELGKFMDVQST